MSLPIKRERPRRPPANKPRPPNFLDAALSGERVDVSPPVDHPTPSRCPKVGPAAPAAHFVPSRQHLPRRNPCTRHHPRSSRVSEPQPKRQMTTADCADKKRY